MKLGFFGGSFNPPTVAHYNLVRQAMEEYNLDSVYFVPVNNLYTKANLVSIDDRIKMLEILCKNDSNIFVSKIERDINMNFKAIDIFKIIEKKFQGNQILFLMGEDNFEKMPDWKCYDELKKYTYIVFQRNEKYDKKISCNNVFYMKNKENIKISSTIIRNKLKKGEPIKGLVTEDVEKYIIDKGLYLEEFV